MSGAATPDSDLVFDWILIVIIFILYCISAQIASVS